MNIIRNPKFLFALLATIPVFAIADTPTQPDIECVTELNEDFAQLKISAMNMLAPDDRQQLVDIKFVEKSKMPFNPFNPTIPSVAMVDEINNEIHFLKKELCSETHIGKKGIIAHELGHFIAGIVYPEYKESLKSKYPKISYEMQEQMANHFGSQIFRQSGIKSDEYLALLDASCKAGSVYHCRASENWKIGLTY